jgi:hypothetical protein
MVAAFFSAAALVSVAPAAEAACASRKSATAWSSLSPWSAAIGNAKFSRLLSPSAAKPTSVKQRPAAVASLAPAALRN